MKKVNKPVLTGVSIPVLDGMMATESKFSDNNPSGKTTKMPGNYTDPANYTGRKKICFASWLADGESPVAPDVKVVAASGTYSSRGQGTNHQYVFPDEARDGHWNDTNGEWPGNLTGF